MVVGVDYSSCKHADTEPQRSLDVILSIQMSTREKVADFYIRLLLALVWLDTILV
jgi:hypothetical protein